MGHSAPARRVTVRYADEPAAEPLREADARRLTSSAWRCTAHHAAARAFVQLPAAAHASRRSPRT